MTDKEFYKAGIIDLILAEKREVGRARDSDFISYENYCTYNDLLDDAIDKIKEIK